MIELQGTIFHAAGGFRWKSFALATLLSSDGKTLHSFHYDGCYVLWDVASGSVLSTHTVPLAESFFETAQFLDALPSHLLILSGRECFLWNWQEQKALSRLRTVTEHRPLQSSPDQSIVVGATFVFDVSEQQFLPRKFPDFEDLAIDPTNQVFAAWKQTSNTLQVVRISDGSVVHEKVLSHPCRAAIFSLDGARLMLSSGPHVYCFSWKNEALHEEQWKLLLDDPPHRLYLRRGQLLFHSEKKFWILDPHNGAVLRSFPSPSGLLCQRDAVDTFIAGEGQPFLRGNFQLGSVEDLLATEESIVYPIALSASDRLLAWSTGSAMTVAEAFSGRILHTFELEQLAEVLLFFVDEHHLCLDGTIYEWNSGALVKTFYESNSNEPQELGSIVVAPDSTQFAWTTTKAERSDKFGTVHLADVHTTDALWEIELPLKYLSISFSRDGTSLWVGNHATRYQLDRNTGKVLARIETKNSFILQLSEDFYFATNILWNPPDSFSAEYAVFKELSQEPLHTFRGIKNELVQPAKGRRLFTERKLLFWNEHTSVAELLIDGVPRALLHIAPNDEFLCAVFSKDERTLFVGTGLGAIYRFDLSSLSH